MDKGKHDKTAAVIAMLLVIAFGMAGCAPKSVLLYDDSINHFAAEALNRLSYNFEKVTTMEDLVEVFKAKEWDLLVMDNPLLDDGETGALVLVNDFVTKGAKAVVSSMNIAIWPGMAVWASMGYHYEGTPNSTPRSIYKGNPSLSIWKRPNAAPELDFDFADDSHVNNGFPGSAVRDGQILAVFSTITPATNAAVISANDGRTILNSFYLDDGVECNIPIDSDGDSIADSVEWWMNEISYVASNPGEAIKPELNHL